MTAKNVEPGTAADTTPPAPSAPQLDPRRSGRKGPNPFLVAGAAFAAGSALAKLIDWRGHAHPRR